MNVYCEAGIGYTLAGLWTRPWGAFSTALAGVVLINLAGNPNLYAGMLRDCVNEITVPQLDVHYCANMLGAKMRLSMLQQRYEIEENNTPKHRLRWYRSGYGNTFMCFVWIV